MTPNQLRHWRKALKLTQPVAAARLGIGTRTLASYEAGKWADGRPAEIPRTVALACAAIHHGLLPWGDEGD